MAVPQKIKNIDPRKKSYDKPRLHIKKQRHYFVNKGPSSQGYGFSSGHVWMWELDYKESWAQKNWCFWTVVLEKTLKSPLDCKEIQQVHPKGDQSWVFIGRTAVEAETPVLWPPDAHLKRPWCWEGLRGGGEVDERRWDGWIASLTQWTWVWVNSRSWWWIGRPGVLQFMGLQSWTWLSNWTELSRIQSYCFSSSHVWMWELDHKEGWVPKNWCLWSDRGWDGWMASLTRWTWVWVNSRSWW